LPFVFLRKHVKKDFFPGGTMKRRFNTLFCTLILAACALPALSSSAAAQTADHGPAFELFGGYLGDSGSDHPRIFGARGSYRFSDVWALEATYSKADVGGQVWFGDVSAKAYFLRANRFSFYALGGPGIFRAKAFGETFNQNTVHLGLGTEIDLGARAYLRPEVRGRWATDEITWDARLTEYSLGFGWRF
jgi:opacity protein-like surface antigen